MQKSPGVAGVGDLVEGWGLVGSGVGVGGGMGNRGCEPRIEGIVKCTYRHYTILRIIKNQGGGAIFEPKTL